MTDLPEPLTPPECDLRDLPAMLLDVVRLRDSDIAALPDAEAFRSAVLLWCASWHQLPAASLPDDDVKLARLAGYGRDVNAWRHARAAGAMRGWMMCSDGRLYHPVVAEKANAAMTTRQGFSGRAAKARAAKEAARLARLAAAQTHPAQAIEIITPAPSVTASNIETEIDANTDAESLLSQPFKGREVKGSEGKINPSPSAQDARGSRLPEGWQPSFNDREYAAGLGLDCDRVARDFAGYWQAKPGKEARKTNWSLTWQGWCRREAERRPPAARPQGKLATLLDHYRTPPTTEDAA